MIRAGADEVYCGVAVPERFRRFTLYRGPGASPAQLPDYDELEKIVEYAHKHDVDVVVTVNEPFMSDAMDNIMEKHIRSCIDVGVDAFIVGDLGVLSLMKRLNVDKPLFASTYFASMNSAAVEFLRKLGFSRVILERHLTLREIAGIVEESRVPIEVFCHAGGCSNINTNCYFYHYGIFSKLLGAELKVRKHVKSVVSPCTLFYDVYDIDEPKVKLGNLPILDAFTYCTMCYLQELVRIGVAGLKIVGRFNRVEEQEAYTLAYRELLDAVVREGARMPRSRFMKKVEALRRRFDELELGRWREEKPKEKEFKGRIDRIRYETLKRMLESPFREIFCKQKRCLYINLLNTPYKHFTPWKPERYRK